MATSFPKLSILEDVVGAARKQPRGGVEVTGLWGSAKTLLAVQLAEAMGYPLLFVSSGRIEAEAIHDDLCTFAGEDRSAFFPAWEVLPTDTMNPADDIVAERMNTLKRLALALDAGEPIHTVLPLRALLQQVVNRKRLNAGSISLKVGEAWDMDTLLERLVAMGYERDVMVEDRGEMSVRGGILDIFPISSELPYRLEFFGDEIESIRRFEPETQRSIAREEAIHVLPRSEKAMLSNASSEVHATITNYFPKNTIVVFDEPLVIEDTAQQLMEQIEGSRYYESWDNVKQHLQRYLRLSLYQVAQDKAQDAIRFRCPTQSIRGWAGAIDDFWEQLKQWDLAGYTVQLYCVNTGERRRLIELLEEQGYRPGRDAFDLRIEIGRMQAGFVLPNDKLAVLSEREMFGRHYMRRTRRRFEAGVTITQFSDLKVGDYVVHADHGIARYTGLRRFEGRAGDFMTLQYAGGDIMYVPVTHIDQVQKYTGGDGAVPKVDRLGGATWAKKKSRVKKAVRDMTEELVKLYAAREARQGFAFSPDTHWQHEFEDAFEYDETPDQLRAIEEVKRDMESPRPMDRLLCGDVGYGKTEVALRAAFKAVMDHRQVAILAPTTVLTQQHYSTLSERLADYPIRIELLNRFRTAKELRETIERLKSGEVDIVVGTHRLVSKDVQFKDLGLVIIDEEQRFGVKHKEALKQLRSQVDVLTMTATPIPRTLHFSLIGIRDMSTINTAPNDRLPIHTCIESWDENTIKEAIERELARQGQVFFLHNRVQTIEHVMGLVKKLCPHARIGMGHGQMPRHQLEEVMSAFINHDLDILVCTTIIGSGIDIPNANTIIVDRADMFGLSELYQIRGRVGRYKHRAFAYLLIPGDRALSEEAMLRLQALEDFSALGSGFRIAMRDLEIRGCGNILGGEQSGNIAAVGYETYKDLIAEAVAEHRGEPLRIRSLPLFELSVDAHIPDAYIESTAQKMTLYRRISAIQHPEEVDEMLDELQDRFGRPPNPVRRLLEVMRTRAMAAEIGVKLIIAGQERLQVVLQSSSFLEQDNLNMLRQKFGNELEASWQKDKDPALSLGLNGSDPVNLAQQFLKALADEDEDELDEF